MLTCASVCRQGRRRAREVEGGHPGAQFLPFILLALLVQKYKYRGRAKEVEGGHPVARFLQLRLLLYWYKSTNTDASEGEVASHPPIPSGASVFVLLYQ